MRIFFYSLQTAIKNLWYEKWINILTALSISISLLIISGFITITFNIDSMLKKWSKSFGIIAYVEEGATGETEKAIHEMLKKDPDIIEVRFISREMALNDLREILGEHAPVVDELGENPLPSSFELRLRSDLLDPESVKIKAEEISRIPGIEKVQYGEKWLSSLYTVSLMLKAGTTLTGMAIVIAIVFLTYNTIKVFFYRRKDEVDTLKLLGATRSFIRLPFLIEGFFIGLAGGLISSLLLYGIIKGISVKGSYLFPVMGSLIISLPLEIYLYIPLSGAIISTIGSYIAVGKIKY